MLTNYGKKLLAEIQDKVISNGLGFSQVNGSSTFNPDYKIYTLNNGFTIAIIKDIKKAHEMVVNDNSFILTLKDTTKLESKNIIK